MFTDAHTNTHAYTLLVILVLIHAQTRVQSRAHPYTHSYVMFVEPTHKHSCATCGFVFSTLALFVILALMHAQHTHTYGHSRTH